MDIDIAKIIDRAKNIILTPKKEWPIIEAEKTEHIKILKSWLLPLSLIPATAAFIGYGIFLRSLGLGLAYALLQLLVILGGAYLTAFIINILAEKFASEKNLNQAFALIAYSYTPACLGGIFYIIPSLSFIGSLIGLYSLYLIYIGIVPMMKTPAEKNTTYFIAILLCTIGVFFILSAVLGAIFIGGMMC